MSEEQMSAVMGSTKTLRTYVDGSLVIQLEIEPRHAQQAFALFGAPGTPIALARITNEAAVAQDRQEQADEGYGKHYAVLYKSGWFHNPKVIVALGVQKDLPPDDRIKAIKELVYEHFDVGSLTDLHPEKFKEYCYQAGIFATLPAAFGTI